MRRLFEAAVEPPFHFGIKRFFNSPIHTPVNNALFTLLACVAPGRGHVIVFSGVLGQTAVSSGRGTCRSPYLVLLARPFDVIASNRFCLSSTSFVL